MSKINLQRGKLTVENRKSREKKRICSEVSVNSPGNPWSWRGTSSKRNCIGTSNAKKRDLYCFLTMEMNEPDYKIKGPHWNALRCYSNGDLYSEFIPPLPNFGDTVHRCAVSVPSNVSHISSIMTVSKMNQVSYVRRTFQFFGIRTTNFQNSYKLQVYTKWWRHRFMCSKAGSPYIS